MLNISQRRELFFLVFNTGLSRANQWYESNSLTPSFLKTLLQDWGESYKPFMNKIFLVLGCACIAFSCSTTPKSSGVDESKSDTTVSIDPISSEVTSESGDPSDWDQAIDQYEDYIDQYIVMLKKSKAGDMTALTESAELMEKAESASKSLDDAKGDLTTEQQERLLKIQTKMFEAVK